MEDQLNEIPSSLHIHNDIVTLLHAIEKEYLKTANYAKGHGDQFHHWMLTFCQVNISTPLLKLVIVQDKTLAWKDILWYKRIYVSLFLFSMIIQSLLTASCRNHYSSCCTQLSSYFSQKCWASSTFMSVCQHIGWQQHWVLSWFWLWSVGYGVGIW